MRNIVTLQVTRFVASCHTFSTSETDEYQSFARKLLWQVVDALEEIRAIERLSTHGNHINLVAILDHGRIAGFYYIDMEICNGNLEDYIQGIRSDRFEAALNPLFSDKGIRQIGEIATIWDIMEQIACGLCFIHGCREVHRDLKPRNGTSMVTLLAHC